MKALEAPRRYGVSLWDKDFTRLIARRGGDDVDALKHDLLSTAHAHAWAGRAVLLVRDSHALGIGQTTIYDILEDGTLVERLAWNPLAWPQPKRGRPS